MLLGYPDVYFSLKKPPAIRYQRPPSVPQPLSVILSALAYAGRIAAEEIQRAFQAGVGAWALKQPTAPAPSLPREQCTLAAFDAALTELAQAEVPLKCDMIAAATACIAADGKITLEESELLLGRCLPRWHVPSPR